MQLGVRVTRYQVGRKGTAVSFSFPAYQLNLQLIIDPKTGKLLSSGHTGGKNGDKTVLLLDWTNNTPAGAAGHHQAI